MKQTELIIGNCYKTSYPTQGEYIFRYDGSITACYFINHSTKLFYTIGNMSEGNGFKDYKLASKEETIHLLRCISTNRYIPEIITPEIY